MANINHDDLMRHALSAAIFTIAERRQQLFALVPRDTFSGLNLYFKLGQFFSSDITTDGIEDIAKATRLDPEELLSLIPEDPTSRPLQHHLVRLLSARQTAAQSTGQDIFQWAEAITNIMQAVQEPLKKARKIILADWCCTRYEGPSPKTKWLVKNIFPLGVPLMVAAMGDTGKSFSLLRLAYLIATGGINNTDKYHAFGGPVEACGTAVVFTAEDSQNTVHARIRAIDETDRLKNHPGKLLVIPLPDAGGPLSLVSKSRDTLMPTLEYGQIKEQLLTIPDLRMVVFDPLQNFTTLDLNAPENSQFICGVMAELATVTGAAVFVSHHMKKTERQIASIAEAREAIRGTTALVDGLRGAYALWPESEEKTRRICNSLGCEYQFSSVVCGAVVKANGPADRRIKTYHRDNQGILQDVTEQLTVSVKIDHKMLVDAIEAATIDHHPFTKSGKAGVHERRIELPEPFNSMSRNKLFGIIDSLLEGGQLVKAAAGSEKVTNWLDIPGGIFATGSGEFAPGARTNNVSE